MKRESHQSNRNASCRKYGVHKLATPLGIKPRISSFIEDQTRTEVEANMAFD